MAAASLPTAHVPRFGSVDPWSTSTRTRRAENHWTPGESPKTALSNPTLRRTSNNTQQRAPRHDQSLHLMITNEPRRVTVMPRNLALVASTHGRRARAPAVPQITQHPENHQRPCSSTSTLRRTSNTTQQRAPRHDQSLHQMIANEPLRVTVMPRKLASVASTHGRRARGPAVPKNTEHPESPRRPRFQTPPCDAPPTPRNNARPDTINPSTR